MRRTKPASANSRLSASRNIGTQTENFDSLIEVAKLEEQVKMLQLENNVLRKHTENFNKLDNVVHPKSVYVTPKTTSKINVEKSYCGCKGNCSSRICGCVKKSNKCGPLCKCDVKMCQNQKSKSNQENKENVDRSDMETPKKQSRKKNETVAKIKTKSLFSPDKRQLYKHFEEGQLSDIYFSFNEKDTISKNSQTDSDNTNNMELKKKKKGKKEVNDKEQQELTEKVIFDPMKPRHQLSRTPPSSKNLEKPLEIEHIIQPQLHSEPAQEVATISSPKVQDIKEEKVDWEEHTAQLIPCKKCKRTFLPNRIQKHEACCKKV